MAAKSFSVPPSGVWAPAVTLFDPATDKLLLDDQARYYAYLASTGLAGLVILGTNAETFLLTRTERRQLLETARKAVGPTFPIMAGVSGHSTAQVLEFIEDAHAAGANYALVLPPAYFGAKASPPAMVNRFYDDVAAATQLPLVLYNFPAVCNGVDLDSDAIAHLARRHPGVVVGTKLTCGSVAKVTRLAAELPRDRFAVFAGQADFLLGALAVGGAGCIAAFANVFPKTTVRIYDQWVRGNAGSAAGVSDTRTAEVREADRAAALELHRTAALAERPCKNGIATTKYAAAVFTAGPPAGIADAETKLQPRRPYLAPTDAEKARCRELMAAAAAIEAAL
ncbi:dihydrodipicolinate synthetase family protein [Niveomyces insectorum RCEF 264]|uniref:Dihydrodipicolinate synthetase family protein n=1 Tax=Niveomyces insectorum RCEF 264 TaxID=1081102 RepID=A0A167ST01_9HYPO|nr:dihydrodipicolinate synthetase family protein [Niveomyces insectorum RCEF 264]